MRIKSFETMIIYNHDYIMYIIFVTMMIIDNHDYIIITKWKEEFLGQRSVIPQL